MKIAINNGIMSIAVCLDNAQIKTDIIKINILLFLSPRIINNDPRENIRSLIISGAYIKDLEKYGLNKIIEIKNGKKIISIFSFLNKYFKINIIIKINKEFIIIINSRMYTERSKKLINEPIIKGKKNL